MEASNLEKINEISEKKYDFENLGELDFLEKNEKNEITEDFEKTPENVLLNFLRKCGIEVSTIHFLDGILIPREVLLIGDKYDDAMKLMNGLKEVMKNMSSSSMTCMHKNAATTQKWPLINLVRQILKANHYKMTPVRKCNGYDKSGKKKFLRFYKVDKIKKIL